MYESIKYVKFQTDVMKDYDKKRIRSAAFPWRLVNFDSYEQKSQGITNGNFIMFIPEDMFFLDRKKLFKGDPMNANTLMDTFIRNANKAFNTGIVQDAFKDLKKFRLRQIKIDNPNCEMMFIDDALASKYFDLTVCSLKAVDDKSPLLLYEGDILTGLIMPVNYHSYNSN